MKISLSTIVPRRVSEWPVGSMMGDMYYLIGETYFCSARMSTLITIEQKLVCIVQWCTITRKILGKGSARKEHANHKAKKSKMSFSEFRPGKTNLQISNRWCKNENVYAKLVRPLCAFRFKFKFKPDKSCRRPETVWWEKVCVCSTFAPGYECPPKETECKKARLEATFLSDHLQRNVNKTAFKDWVCTHMAANSRKLGQCSLEAKSGPDRKKSNRWSSGTKRQIIHGCKITKQTGWI